MSQADTEAVELLPCPFCGGDARHSLYVRDGGKVQCTNDKCYANTFQFNPSGNTKAIAAWNTRTPPIDVEAVARDLFDFLCRKYVQRSNERQQSMGLQYTEAETHDLAKEIARFIAAMRANEEKS